MNNIAIIAGVTLREAARRKILWTALFAGALFLAIFAIALRLQVMEFQSRPCRRSCAIRSRAACS